ncbi:Transport and Golgi organization protein 6 [Portunus trituberculatus]|uniref:Transport and Golgi organization protein 6 n=1 Tax=Portunus trituberculatus TaxID=210409 RepID=A0A5B7DIG3_PORTR|nr:Transport and Golgi organization protein 6 [Portunus trituberculatus]
MDHRLYQCVEQLATLDVPLARLVSMLSPSQLFHSPDDTKISLQNLINHHHHHHHPRLQCGCLSVSLLHHLARLLEGLEEVPAPTPARGRGGGDPDAPPPPPHLLSLHQTQVVAAAARLALYTAVLAGMDQESARFVKMSLARAKFILGPSLLEVPQGSRHSLLAGTMRLLVPIVKDLPAYGIPDYGSPACISNSNNPITNITPQHDTLGSGIRQSCFPEMLSALLCLCFCPSSTTHHPQDTAFFRAQLEALTAATDPSVTLTHLLLLMGLAQVVVGAGLALCDGQDVRRCQAVAALIAHSRTPDLTSFYASVGPQLAPEVVRVVVLLAGELAERSPSLAAQHLGQPLLQPLTLTTQPLTPPGCREASLTECVARLHTLMIDTAPPTPALARLLQPALCPLLVITTMSVTHLRSPARHLITKYLSHLAKEEVVGTLVSLAGLVQTSASPPVNPDLALVLDAAGGVKVAMRSGPGNALEEDEATASCLSGILEDLGQPGTVLAFYRKLVEFFDFKETQEPGTAPSLVTEADRVAGQFERVRRVAMCVTLLSCLAESEKLTGDLFQDLSAAGPVVDGLLRAGCQDCVDEGLKDIQVSLAANVLILVTCYVSDRSLRKDMTSGDWAGLRALLPALEMTEECLQDEGVCLMASQLRHMVATHGVFKADVMAGTQTQGRAGKANSATRHSKEVKGTQDRHDKGTEVTGEVKTENAATLTEERAKDSNMSKLREVDMKTKKMYKGDEESERTLVRREEEVKAVIKQDISEVKEEQKEEEIKEEMSEVIRIKEEAVERRQEGSNTKKEGREEEANANTKQDDKTKRREKVDDGETKNKKTENTTAEKNKNTTTTTIKQEESEENEEDKIITEKQKKEENTFESAMEDLMSPLLPIRGHGILALARLVEERDSTALQHGTQLLALFQRHLREDDSYLYLMAARGLAALCDVMPEKAVVVVTQEFSVGRRSAEDRAKLAESLSRAAQEMDVTFLCCVLLQVFSVLKLAVASDESVEVRRAAVLVVTMLLQGLGGSAIKVLSDVLRDLYRTLRFLEANDSDQVVRIHSQLAIQEVDSIMRRFFMPSSGLSKRIFVLDAPPPAL